MLGRNGATVIAGGLVPNICSYRKATACGSTPCSKNIRLWPVMMRIITRTLRLASVRKSLNIAKC